LAISLDLIEQRISRDEKLGFTLLAYAAVLTIFVNLSTLQSPILGLIGSAVYFLINGIFLGHSLFGKEDPFFKLMLGILMLLVLLGFIGWLAVIIYDLNIVIFIVVLLMTTTISSLLNRKRMTNIAP
jgi:hypothetical protein